MKHLRFLLLLILIVISFQMTAQNLSQHQWNDRVLLIMTDNSNSVEFQEQIKALGHHNKELEDRQLVIYQMTPTSYKIGLSEENEWIKRPELYREIKTNNKSFEVVLVGLDGGEKLRQSDVLPTDKLFSIIDGMPMRRAELRKNK